MLQLTHELRGVELRMRDTIIFRHLNLESDMDIERAYKDYERHLNYKYRDLPLQYKKMLVGGLLESFMKELEEERGILREAEEEKERKRLRVEKEAEEKRKRERVKERILEHTLGAILENVHVKSGLLRLDFDNGKSLVIRNTDNLTVIERQENRELLSSEETKELRAKCNE